MASDRVNIIKKVEVIEGGGHHGGAWKVAYADFMTAMMAFFLLMWILSSSDEQKLRGIAEYFTNATMPGGSGVLDGATLGPPGTLNASNGAIVARGAELGQIDDPSPARWEVMDTTPTADPEEKAKGSNEGVFDNPAAGNASDSRPPETARDAEVAGDASSNAIYEQVKAAPYDLDGDADAEAMAAGAAENAVADAADQHAADVARFEKLQVELLQAMQDNPDLRPLKQNLIFERTPDGLRIQIIDQEGRAMFASGSAKMAKATRMLMETLGQSLQELPNEMVISGHTDAVPFTKSRDYDNWDLSSDRANAMRRVLLQSGVDHTRITRVSGLADTELLKPEAPKDAANRRIEVLLAYDDTPKAEAPAQPMAQETQQAAAPSEETKTPMQASPAPQQAEVKPQPTAPAQAAQRVTLLDDKVFENLRSALR